MVRRTILTGLIVGICGIMTYVFADEPPPKQEKEKSELAKIMDEIDKSYKAVEEISGYYKYSDNDWKVIAESSANIARLTKTIIGKFSRPDDQKYQDLNKTMMAEAEKMHEIVSHKGEQGALEDAQWQVRRLRQACALCHKHLGIHLYPQLYPGKKKNYNLDRQRFPRRKKQALQEIGNGCLAGNVGICLKRKVDFFEVFSTIYPENFYLTRFAFNAILDNSVS